MDLKLRKRANLNNKTIIIGIAFFLLTIMGIGFSYLESRLNINGNITIVNGLWDVHFENLAVTSGSVTAITPAKINSDRRKVTFAVKLTNQTDFYQFEVDVVNSGELDAMVGDAQIKGLPDSLKDFVDYTLTYSDGAVIRPTDKLLKGTKERVKVKLKFKDNINLSLMPVGEQFDLSLEISYIQASDDAQDKKVTGNIIQLLGLDKTAKLDTGIDFYSISSDTNGKGLYIYTNSDGSIYNPENPIYYYRGEVDNNNIIFADYCWKIVRTTESGGTKLIYNGPPVNGTCSVNTSSVLGSTKWHDYNNYSGLKYQYTAARTIVDNWYSKNIENAASNLHYGKYLEDIIWCLDKSETESKKVGTLTKYFYGYGARNYLRKEKPRLTCPTQGDRYTLNAEGINYNAELLGNKLLNYPAAYLTADEAQLAGYVFFLSEEYDENKINSSSYLLKYNEDFWLMSPVLGYNDEYSMVYMERRGYMTPKVINTYAGSRPCVSLVNGTKVRTEVASAPGTPNNPYLVVYD